MEFSTCSAQTALRWCTVFAALAAAPAPGGYPSVRVELGSHFDTVVFGASAGNSCWGYVSASGREYAIMGLDIGTAFVEVTDPYAADIITTKSGPISAWRDMKTYQNYSYSVSEGGGGIQVFDLNQIDSGIVTLVNTVTSGGPTVTHTLALNEASGYLVRCGGGSEGLRFYSLANPSLPVYEGEWSDRYVHEAQVVSYTDGPYAGKEIAFCYGGSSGGFASTGLYIVDVTNKSAPVQLSYLPYFRASYAHQGWLSEDKRYVYVNDEFDEGTFGIYTNTHIIDVSDLSNPVEVSNSSTGSLSIDHNEYVDGRLLFQANYTSGLRIFDLTDPMRPVQIAYFDTYPNGDPTIYEGLWNNYPLFPSGTVIGSDIEGGLFVWNVQQARDCNGNTIDDATDIASGTSADLDQNRLPDECQTVHHVPADFATIQDALDAAGFADMIMVADGTYSGPGNYNLDFAGKVVSLISESGPDPCMIDGGGLGRVFHHTGGESFGTIVDGFTITGGSADFGGGIRIDNAGGVFRNCIITGNSAANLGGAVYASQSSFLITNCRIIDNQSDDAGGVFFDSCIATLRHSLIAGNSANDIAGGGIYIRGTVGPTIENCTVVRNSAAVNGGGVYVVGGKPSFRNCIIRDNAALASPQVHLALDASVAIEYSNVSGGFVGLGNIDTDPQFADPDGVDNDPDTVADNDYHLLTTSPCVDAGDPSFENVPEQFDFDMQPRLNGLVDMGADEVYPPSCPQDTNMDAMVDPLDYGFVLARLGCAVGAGDSACDTADVNGDGVVDPLDGGYVQARFGVCP